MSSSRSSAAHAEQTLESIRLTVIEHQALNLKQVRTLITTLTVGRLCDRRPVPVAKADDVIKMLEDLQRTTAAWLERWGR